MADGRQDDVKNAIISAMGDTSLAGIIDDLNPVLAGGKMLRGNLVLCLAPAGGLDDSEALACSAAVEMIHAASLVHDDVIDGGILRRGVPTFWKEKGTSGAILLGDLLVCKAFGLLAATRSAGVIVPALIRFAGELCDAETEQELVLRGVPSVWKKYVDVVRRKTGSLFAFAASVCGEDEEQRRALEDAGYAIGTAYQIADDFYDVYGDPLMADKSLGRDAVRSTGSAHSFEGLKGCDPVQYVDGLVASSREALGRWHELGKAWSGYIAGHFEPAIERFLVSARNLTVAERCVGS